MRTDIILATQTADPAAAVDLPDTSCVTMHVDMLAAAMHVDTLTAAMAGYQPNDMTPAERNAASRGVSPALYRRLSPAVTGPAVDAAAGDLFAIRDALLARLPQSEAARLIGDPRSKGFRVHVHTLRCTVGQEADRTALFHLELALTQLGEGSTRGLLSIRKARAALGI